MEKVKWGGSTPVCNFCNTIPTEGFVDGKTTQGPWAIMCLDCAHIWAVGLGLGKGQMYCKKNEDWIKIFG